MGLNVEKPQSSGIPKVIYRASYQHMKVLGIIPNRNYSITYRNSKGETVKLNWQFDEAVEALNIINKYFTKNNPVLSKEQADVLCQEACKTFKPKKYQGRRDTSVDYNTIFRDAIKDFTESTSEGGTNITPNEVYQMYERVLGE